MKKSQSTCKDEKVQLTVFEPSTKMRLMNLAEKKSLPGVKVSAASVAAFFVEQGVLTPEWTKVLFSHEV